MKAILKVDGPHIASRRRSVLRCLLTPRSCNRSETRADGQLHLAQRTPQHSIITPHGHLNSFRTRLRLTLKSRKPRKCKSYLAPDSPPGPQSTTNPVSGTFALTITHSRAQPCAPRNTTTPSQSQSMIYRADRYKRTSCGTSREDDCISTESTPTRALPRRTQTLRWLLHDVSFILRLVPPRRPIV
jgi:hypothetical protein